jgi:hypothetical protein
MAEAIAERVRRYILDGGDEDLRRLLGVAETAREMARSAFRRVGMGEGCDGPIALCLETRPQSREELGGTARGD